MELQAWVNRIRGVPDPLAEDLATARDGLVATAVAEATVASMTADGRFTAISDLFGLPPSVDGAASRAFFLPTRFITCQTAQPMTALRRFTTLTASTVPARACR